MPTVVVGLACSRPAVSFRRTVSVAVSAAVVAVEPVDCLGVPAGDRSADLVAGRYAAVRCLVDSLADCSGWAERCPGDSAAVDPFQAAKGDSSRVEPDDSQEQVDSSVADSVEGLPLADWVVAGWDENPAADGY